ncbi:VOC family protein [Arthrobacter sp. ISL-48]|uniref:VOC family protein n=1 Tax=Arthrobacter sp. ISL-48 TaxID=2819110 RepID=UPI001BE90798|nr:VOC family protein [Arthrobacter sp. ISL-48]MBT2531342.1 VOC family protein [Arthrobacter sp. ISL-48]
MSAIWIATVTIKTARPRDVARFWRELLGYRIAPNHSESVKLVGDDGPTLLIQASDRPIQQGAIHLDLRPEDQSACVRRALKLGATHADIGQSGDEGWVVLADPGGNLFCILQSEDHYKRSLANNPGTPSPID